ncbi:hypothetical protein Aazo_5137 ['Nostoc azollae' 0708]|uniref:Uncharacterized protein n=1 Tax=Nostoc azollae (strain 0708) TaxID=551115 RepID=D7E033_NOSA0|nr:hypothetical protein Aazo_5137 ['Nostoc azollae' 0708]
MVVLFYSLNTVKNPISGNKKTHNQGNIEIKLSEAIRGALTRP